ncbi:MAG: c-type cytochrome [Trueperaceae bacterium]
MLTAILIGALALIAFAYVALPLLAPNQADPLPDDRDPVLVDLQEEKAALFRAIRELEARTDLAPERREQLRARYEAKAAKVLRSIDDREAELAGRARPQRTAARRVPVGVAAVLALMLVTAAVLPTFVLPRVGEDATITTTDMELAQQLQALQNAARQDPNATNLLALGDAYLSLQQVEDAETAYRQVVETIEPVPAGAYQRMAILSLQSDLAQAHEWLRLARAADPFDPDTLYLLGEVGFARGDIPEALSAYRDYAAAIGLDGAAAAVDGSGDAAAVDGSGDAAAVDGTEGSVEVTAVEQAIRQRLALLEELAPLAAAVEEAPTLESTMDLAGAYWRAGERSRAVEHYFIVLTEFDPDHVLALGRTGQLLYTADRLDDAIGLLERAAAAAGGVEGLEPGARLSLAHAYLRSETWQQAVDAYRAYLADPGTAIEGNASAAPDPLTGVAEELLAIAEARAAGRDPAGGESAMALLFGQQVFESVCAECHGAAGEGGIGPRLAGSERAANRPNVLDAVRFGRGAMPAFQAALETSDLEAVVTYVTDVLAPEQ